ncbi:glycosyltransferase family 2 protein [Buttiauxella sp. S04-F03]|uniref:glycosyltransferase family 2 protein n=1 Tax=Buttiauxella sp. W03-F01 TaxID=2904524 RepID=UPI001E5EEF7A|nr:glycosyltransferase family A protein [Buttiauxella sp. W03-F01]MCE0800528.1 glycosyltransferase family 2 protein [Buttiauxella sp. W03-F01]
MKNKKLKFGVTVVIPTYNRKDKLISAVNSVTSSDKDVVEIIIVDDCSDISPESFFSAFNSDNIVIRIYKNYKNSGPQVARNLGIRRARFNHIAFLDSDDLFVPGKIDWIINILKNDDIDFLYHGVDGCEKYNKLSRLWFKTIGKIFHFRWFLYLLNPCVTPSVVIKNKKCLFNPTLRHSEDYAFFLSYVDEKTRVRYYDDIYTIVPREIGSMGGISNNLIKMRKGEMQGKNNLLRRNYYVGFIMSYCVAILRVLSDLCRKRYSLRDFIKK